MRWLLLQKSGKVCSMSLRLRVLICWYAFPSFFHHVQLRANILIPEFVKILPSLILVVKEYAFGQDTLEHSMTICRLESRNEINFLVYFNVKYDYYPILFKMLNMQNVPQFLSDVQSRSYFLKVSQVTPLCINKEILGSM